MHEQITTNPSQQKKAIRDKIADGSQRTDPKALLVVEWVYSPHPREPSTLLQREGFTG